MTSNRVKPRATPGPVRAVSVKAPSAWAILHAGKRVENRSRKSPWSSAIGKVVLLHASAQFTIQEYEDAWMVVKAASGVRLPPRLELPAGGIVGSFILLDVLDLRDGYVPPTLGDQTGYAFGPWGLVLVEVQSFPFRPCKGHQGLWTVPEEVWL